MLPISEKLLLTSIPKTTLVQIAVVFGREIEFRRVESIPEPSFTLGILALGVWGTSKIVLGKYKQKSTVKERASV